MSQQSDVQSTVPTRPPLLQSPLKFIQSARFRAIGLTALLIGAELILAVRYSPDTYFKALAEHRATLPPDFAWLASLLSFLDVAVLDALWILLLAVTKFGGTSDKGSKLRVFGWFGSILIFSVMIGVATDAIPVILGARLAGGLFIAFVGSDLLIDLSKRVGGWLKTKRAKQAAKPPARPFAERLLAANFGLGYLLAVVCTLPLGFAFGLIRVFADYWKVAGDQPSPNIVFGVGRGTASKPNQTRQLGAGDANLPRLPEGDYHLDAIGMQLLTLWETNPYASNPELAAQVGLTAEAVRLRRHKMEKAGMIQIKANGHGKVVEVVR